MFPRTRSSAATCASSAPARRESRSRGRCATGRCGSSSSRAARSGQRPRPSICIGVQTSGGNISARRVPGAHIRRQHPAMGWLVPVARARGFRGATVAAGQRVAAPSRRSHPLLSGGARDVPTRRDGGRDRSRAAAPVPAASRRLGTHAGHGGLSVQPSDAIRADLPRGARGGTQHPGISVRQRRGTPGRRARWSRDGRARRDPVGRIVPR